MWYRNEIGDGIVGLRSRKLGRDVLLWRLELLSGGSAGCGSGVG